MVEAQLSLSHLVQAPCAPDVAWALVSDVPRSVSHFPGLDGLDDLGGLRYRWRLARFEVGPVHFDASYTAQYHLDPAARVVRWETVQRENLAAAGSWTVLPLGAGCQLAFQTRLDLSVPCPRVFRPAVQRAIPVISGKQMKTYAERIAATLGGRLV
ncbi:MAG: SRPBCC family protein [Alphaproteobacteria bacterium]|nr:SRPBCC family protein [Alphaproteobacteria bacterium]